MGNLTTMQAAGVSRSGSSAVSALEPSGMFQRSQLATSSTINSSIAIATPQHVALPATRPPVIHRSDLAGVKSADLVLFFQLLAPLVKSGMTIHAALDNVANRIRNKSLALVAHEMAQTARTGGRVSDVMDRYPRIFADNIVGTIRAGELGGFLEVVLAEVALNYEQHIALYRGSWKWKAWVVQSMLTLALVIPLFTSVLDSMDMGANLRLYAQREMIVLPIFGLIYLASILLTKYVQTPERKRWRDEMSLKVPVVGDLQRQSALSAFIRMLRKLNHAGVGPIQAWEAAMYTADNTAIRERLASAYILIQRGGSLSDAFTRTGLFADNVEQLLITGQLSGEITDSLDKAANIYQNNVQESQERTRIFMMRAARLTTIVLMGIAVAWMMKSYFASVFHFVDANFSE